MNELRAWIITLVTMTILCNLIEKFAPQGSLNKYVRLVCGLAVTVVIAMPAIQLIKGNFELDTVAWNDYFKLSEGELKRRVDRLKNEDSRRILELYRKTIMGDIKSRFMGEKEFVVTHVDAVLVEDPGDQDFGAIRALYLTLRPGSENYSKVLPQAKINAVKAELSRTFQVDESKILIDASQFSGGG